MGVALLVLRGISEGDGCVSRGNSGLANGFGTSSCGVGGPKGRLVGMGGAAIDILLSRRASVGLTVLAPNPLALPDTVDCRLLPDEDGVCSRFWPLFETGLSFGVSGSARGGGCRLLTLFARDCVVAVNVDRRGSSAPADAEGWMVVRRALLRLLVRARDDLRFGSTGVEGAC